MEKYYVLDRDCSGRWIDTRRGTNTPPVDWYYWRKGAPLPETEEIPDPITFDLRPYYEEAEGDAQYMPSFLRASAPLWRDDLIQALREAGVDNIECYNTAIRDPDNGEVHTNYKAVNIVGLVAAVDWDKSKATVPPDGSARTDVDLDGFSVDASKTGQFLLFRSAESTNGILIHESVKRHLEQKGFTDLAFYPPEEAAL